MSKICFNEKRQQWEVFAFGRQFAYRVSRYGKFAVQLAVRSFFCGKRYNDFFKRNDNGTTTFFVNSKVYGVVEVIVDTEDESLFYSRKISISNDNHAKTMYAKTKDGNVHRIIMQFPEGFVDHIDRNGLNNSKSNLRVVTTSVNNRNQNLRCDNTSGYRVFYYDNSMRKLSKSFSKIKYGKEEALQMALDYRDAVYKRYGYIM